MDLWLENFLAKRTTTTVTPAKEELGPGWAMDDVYPPLAELRRALLTDEEWAAMSSWEKDVWEMFYRPDWESLACIEQILVDTPAAQRVQRHEEILEALHSFGASISVSVDHLDESHVVSVDAAVSAIVEEEPEDIHSASTGVITTTTATCSTVCVPRHPVAVPVLVASWPPTLTEYSVDTNRIHVAVVPLAITAEFSVDAAPTDSAPTVQLQQLYNDSESFMLPTSSQCILTKVVVHRPMPWPSFVGVHADGDEARPLPWPSFSVICDCEFPRDATACDVIRFSLTAFYRILELKLLPIFSTVVTLSAVIVDSGNFAAFACEYLGIYTTVCIWIWLFAGCLLAVCQKYSVQSSTDYLSLPVPFHWSIGACYLAWIIEQENEIAHVVVVEEYYEPKFQREHQRKEFTGIEVATQSDLRVLMQFSWRVLKPWPPLVEHVFVGVELTHDGIPFDLQKGCVDITNCNITAWFSAISVDVTELQGVCVSTQLQCGNIASVLGCWVSGLIHLEQLCQNWKFVHSAVDQPTFIIPIQSGSLKDREIWWFTTAFLTEISSLFSTGFAMQLVVACPVKSILMLTHAYQLRILAPTKFSLAWSNLNNHAEEQWDSALDCLFNAIKQFSSGPVLHMQQLRSFSVSEGSGELSQWLANNLWHAYQLWLVAWTGDIIRAAFSDQFHISHDYYIAFINRIPADSYNYRNQALYFDTVSTDLSYYNEDSHGDPSKSKELHVPWDPGKLVLRYHRKLRLADKPSFKEGGVLAPSPAYPMLGRYDGLAPMGRAQGLALLLIHDRRPSKNHPVGSRTRHGNTARRLPHHHCNSPY